MRTKSIKGAHGDRLRRRRGCLQDGARPSDAAGHTIALVRGLASCRGDMQRSARGKHDTAQQVSQHVGGPRLASGRGG